MNKYTNLWIINKLEKQWYLSEDEYFILKKELLSNKKSYTNKDFQNFKELCSLLYLWWITREEFDLEKIVIFDKSNFEKYSLSIIKPKKLKSVNIDEIKKDISFFKRMNSSIPNTIDFINKEAMKLNKLLEDEMYREHCDEYWEEWEEYEEKREEYYERISNNLWDPSEFDCWDGTITQEDYDNYNRSLEILEDQPEGDYEAEYESYLEDEKRIKEEEKANEECFKEEMRLMLGEVYYKELINYDSEMLYIYQYLR